MTDHIMRLCVGWLVVAGTLTAMASVVALWSVSPWVLAGVVGLAALAYAVGWVIDALTALTMDDGELVGHTPDPVSALYQAEKAIGAKVPVGEVDVGDAGDASEAMQSEEFQDTELGEAVMGALDSMRGGRR